MKPNPSTNDIARALVAPAPLDHSDCHASELLTNDQASLRLGIKLKSTYRTAAAHGIEGRCLGRKVIHKVAARLLVENDLDALALFRSGNRTDPRIVRAYEAEKLTPPTSSERAS